MSDKKATIRMLQARPSVSVDLSFEMGGVIALVNRATGQGPVHLGEPIKAYDIKTALYSQLGQTIPGNDSRLKYDSTEIHKVLTTGAPAPFLFVLRNESLAADLDEMIARRENAFLERFKFAAEIKAAMKKAIPNIINRLQKLQTLALSRFSQIDKAYEEKREDQPKWPVVTQSKTTLSYSPDYKEHIHTDTMIRAIATSSQPLAETLDHKGNASTFSTQTWDEITGKELAVTQVAECSINKPYPMEKKVWKEAWDDWFPGDNSDADGTRTGTQIYTTPNQSYLQPRLDNEVSHEQLQIGLIKDEMERTIFSFRIDSMDRIIENERGVFDLEVRKLQLSYAQSYLVSPVSGMVTAIHKDIGESVKPGEPVLRIENDEVIHAVGKINYRGLLKVGQEVTIETDNLYESGEPFKWKGRLVGVRGDEADDDEWQVVIEITDKNKKLPMYYQFDRNNSWIIVA
jgi:hypothetical protein